MPPFLDLSASCVVKPHTGSAQGAGSCWALEEQDLGSAEAGKASLEDAQTSLEETVNTNPLPGPGLTGVMLCTTAAPTRAGLTSAPWFYERRGSKHKPP